MRTGRPREFCVEEALDSATTVFWRQGYEGASISDLTAAMGIGAPSLYACFGNKESLFHAVLDRYDARHKSFIDSVLAATDARAVAEVFLYGVVDCATDTETPGCLLVQSGLSCGNSEIPEMLAKHRSEREAALRERFEQARKAGDLPKSANAAALARYLMVVANGICVQAASAATAKGLRQVVALSLAGWPAREKCSGETRAPKKPA